jgi:hypothetical protein
LPGPWWWSLYSPLKRRSTPEQQIVDNYYIASNSYHCHCEWWASAVRCAECRGLMVLVSACHLLGRGQYWRCPAHYAHTRLTSRWPAIPHDVIRYLKCRQWSNYLSARTALPIFFLIAYNTAL